MAAESMLGCFHGGRSAPALTDAPPRSLLRSACLTLCAAPHNLGLQGADCGQECLSRPERAAPSGTPAEKSLSLAFSAPQASSATSLSSLLLKDVCSPRVCAACLTLCQRRSAISQRPRMGFASTCSAGSRLFDVIYVGSMTMSGEGRRPLSGLCRTHGLFFWASRWKCVHIFRT